MIEGINIDGVCFKLSEVVGKTLEELKKQYPHVKESILKKLVKK